MLKQGLRSGVCLFLLSVHGAFGQLEWTMRNPLPDPNPLHSVAWTGKTLVAVGDNGLILTSPDSLAWTRRPSGVARTLESVAWTGTQLVAAGWDGVVIASADGNIWTKLYGRDSASWTSVAGNGRKIVAVGSQIVSAGSSYIYKPAVAVSEDGVSWNYRVLDNVLSLQTVVWAGTQYVAVGANGEIATSRDGLAWMARFSEAKVDLNAVIWTGTQIVAGGKDGVVVTSPDGVDWTVRQSMSTILGLAKTDSLIVAVGADGRSQTSKDGITWNWKNDGITNYTLRSVAWTGTRLVAVGWDYRYRGDFQTHEVAAVSTSPDGSTWTIRNSGRPYDLEALAWTNGKFLAVGYSDTMAVSPDGIAWAPQASGTGGQLMGAAWAGTQWVVVGNNGIFTSPDGAAWTRRNSDVYYCVAWSGSQIVVAGWSGFATSLDGITWTSGVRPDNFIASDIAWADTQFVAVGWNGRIVTSTNGLLWKERSSGTKKDLHGVAWAGNQIVVAGDSAILTSPDGSTWTSRYSGPRSILESVAWTGSQIVAVGNDIRNSPDGINWTVAPSGTNETILNAVVWTGTQLVAVSGNSCCGMDGAILTSPGVPLPVPLRSPQNRGLSYRLRGDIPAFGLPEPAPGKPLWANFFTLSGTLAARKRFGSLRELQEMISKGGLPPGAFLLEVTVGGKRYREPVRIRQ